MKERKPLEVVGWISRSGYQTTIHEEARKAAQEGKRQTAQDRKGKLATEKRKSRV